jgi:Ser/Thr protein kinase RdoA (MazF antagonist)
LAARLHDPARGAGFPSPRPLPCFDGVSWIMAGGWLWETVSFLPGHAVGWAPVPPMEEVGALLARYHVAIRRIPVTSQRPAALPLADVPRVLLSHQFDAIPPERAASIRQLAAQLARDLDDTGHLARDRMVIHGDFTNDNVIARGTPPAASGVIDFAGPTWKRRWRTSVMACGAAAAPTSAPAAWIFPESGGFSAATPASSGSRPARPASFPSTCGVVDFR